tara:strand:+ start:37 stop:5166 length:5130 start_codon:yes stop_codon:yes gene_type:complete
MSYYNNTFKRRKIIAGAKGTKPSFLMPPDGAFSKVGYQLYRALDLICEGPIAGLTDQNGKILDGDRALKNFSSDANSLGSSTNGIDKGIYFDDKPLRSQINDSNHSKYNLELKTGTEFQTRSDVFPNATRMQKISVPILGPYSMSVGGNEGARHGSGSQDIRYEGTSARNFVSWQRYYPKERLAKPFKYENRDRNITEVVIGIQIDQLSDTKSKSSKSENKSGRSKMGTPLKETVSLYVEVGKVDKNNVETKGPSLTFTTRSRGGVLINKSAGRITITGIVTAAYTLSLEDITLPELDDDDLYSFVHIHKEQYETVSNLVKRSIGVGTITEICGLEFTYPSSCYVASQIDSKYFPQVPARTFRLKGKKILIPSNYNPINVNGSDRRFSYDTSTRQNVIYSGPWDGTFKFEWSDNPAWIYYDLLVNTRYGIGSHLRDIEVVDKWTLYELGMYCDAVTMNDGSKTTNDYGGPGRFIGLDDGFGGLEPRFSCNIMIKDQASAFEALQDLGRSFRAMTYFNNSSVSVKIDKPYFFEDFNRDQAFETSVGGATAPPKDLKFSPHLVFNNLNVRDGSFAYADVDKSTKLTAVEVVFLDRRKNFRNSTVYEEDQEGIKHVGINYKQIEGIGVTSRAQASRLAKYILFESLNTTETVSFGAGLEGLLLEPGDIIKVDDEMRNFTRNFGTVLGASGETTYYNPDMKTASESGKGPTALIVEPAINSDQLDYITGGNIHIYNPIGKSGIEDFYTNPSSDNDLYKEIHNPQIISLKIKEGGSGVSYDIVDSGVAIYIDGLYDFTNGPNNSQWYVNKDVNIKHGSRYSLDASGRSPNYYRVISVEEDKKQGFNVSATIHHTGKFKFVEENTSFDLDGDTFQPDLLITEIAKPDSPKSITTGAFIQNIDNTLSLPITIEAPDLRKPEKYIIFLEEPNSNIIVSEIFRSTASTFTDYTLSGTAAIDQFGDYQINIFSENVNPSKSRNFIAESLSFTTATSDFSVQPSDSFVDYKNISINTDYPSNFNESFNTGDAYNSFKEGDPETNAVFNLIFEDLFGQEGVEATSSVSGQTINLRGSDDQLIQSGFKSLSNETSFTVLNQELDMAFGYTGDNRYRMPPTLEFEAGVFDLQQSQTSVSKTFDQAFTETPAVFIQQVVDDSFNKLYKKLGRDDAQNSLFSVYNNSDSDTKYSYIASKVGLFSIDANTKKVDIEFVTKDNTSGYQYVGFQQEFVSTPNVCIQLQKPDLINNKNISETCVTGVSTSGFFFASFEDDGVPSSGTGQYAYIALNEESFNTATDSDLPVLSLNYTTTGVQNFQFDSDTVLEPFNGTNNAGLRFNHNNYSVLAQRSGNNTVLNNRFFAVHRTGDNNKVFQHNLDTGLEPGLRSQSSQGELNHILVTGSNLSIDTGNFTLASWVKFDPNLDGKQYLLESHKNGTGVAWFQSGDGKNYINLNGTDFLAATGATTLNDGNLHFLQIVVDRENGLTGYLDDASNFNVNTSITGLRDESFITEFSVAGVGTGISGNTNTFDGNYTGSSPLFQNINTSGLRLTLTGTKWILTDEDPASPSHGQVAWEGGNNVNYPWNVASWTGVDALGTSSAPSFSALSPFVGTSLDSTTGFKLLGNSELAGEALTSGHINKYFALIGEATKGNYVSNPIAFLNLFSGDANTKFIFDTNTFPTLTDASQNTIINTVGNIERSDDFMNNNITSNFNFIQVGTTGIL